jgi:glycogen debranching enzyme
MIANDARPHELPRHVITTSNLVDERTLVLKHGDSFAVFDHHGSIKPGGLGEEGLYHEGTRYLCRLQIAMEDQELIFLGSSVPSGTGQLAIVLTNPDFVEEAAFRLPFGTLHMEVRTLLWRGACYQRVRVKNHGRQFVNSWVSVDFAADYADIFEVRGTKRTARGQDLAPELSGNVVVLGYRGLDKATRHTSLRFDPEPATLSDSRALYSLELGPQQEAEFNISIGCEYESKPATVLGFDEARVECQAEVQRYSSWSCHLGTSNGQLNAWINRAHSDLQMMTTDLPTGPYPYAGVPWFSTPFGRDAIITALECLWLRPELARGVLAFLAKTQATAVIPAQDAEPGKIIHEMRLGELPALGEVPFGRYYGSVDSTPLFIMLAGAHYQRTGDRAFTESLWPNIEAALRWMDEYGDRDRNGFIEYLRQSENGLVHQGWKDSEDSVFHADGTLAHGPIALCEVQGYAYAALRAASVMALALGKTARSAQLLRRAEELKEKFEATFWCEDLSTYAIALDGDNRPCRIRSSNAGQCLFTGIVRPDRARLLARTLFAPESFSGWGIRTVADCESRYNPMSYHNGTVWPHDNAMIAAGLARYNMADKALQILGGLFDAGMFFDLNRMPELFCGFRQTPGEGPVLYPVACAPQAWSAASVFLLFQACLGLDISGVEQTIYFTRPTLPSSLGELRIHNLEVAGATVDLLLVRQENNVGVSVLRREGNVQVLVVT